MIGIILFAAFFYSPVSGTSGGFCTGRKLPGRYELCRLSDQRHGAENVYGCGFFSTDGNSSFHAGGGIDEPRRYHKTDH